MKTTLLSQCIKKCFVTVAIVIPGITAFGQLQTVPELVFQNPVLTSGTAGEDGAKYLFSNVVAGLDAVVEIKGRSSSLVVLSSIDTTGPGLGYANAFQPVLGIPGTAPASTTWSMDFEMIFYKTGTNSKVIVPKFFVTGLDIDGDGQNLFEWSRMEKVESIDTSLINNLTISIVPPYQSGWACAVNGITTNAPGIDTTATNVMATYRYQNKDQINFTIGATNGSLTTSAGMRLNSLWFKQFTYNVALPVKLVSFNAILNNNKVDLKWATASEQNVSHFVVERSFDGINFNDAATVFAFGNTTQKMDYSYSDNISSVQSSVIYYRLRSVDIDGKFEYSEVRIIRISKQVENNITITAYPNPVTNQLNVTIPNNWQNKKVVFEIFNANGQVSKRSENNSGSQTETINVSNLASGFYIVRVSCDGETAQQKIIKK